jgi:hypothetical protein
MSNLVSAIFNPFNIFGKKSSPAPKPAPPAPRPVVQPMASSAATPGSSAATPGSSVKQSDSTVKGRGRRSGFRANLFTGGMGLKRQSENIRKKKLGTT